MAPQPGEIWTCCRCYIKFLSKAGWTVVPSGTPLLIIETDSSKLPIRLKVVCNKLAGYIEYWHTSKIEETLEKIDT